MLKYNIWVNTTGMSQLKIIKSSQAHNHKFKNLKKNSMPIHISTKNVLSKVTPNSAELPYMQQ